MIIDELKNKGIEVTKSDSFFIGYRNTEAGVQVSRKEKNCENGIYFLENSVSRPFPCNDDIVYVASGTEYEGKVKSKKEAEELAKEGKIWFFKSSDLYAEYYDFAHDKELECAFKYGYSSRSREYIESLMNNIGLKYYTDVSDGHPDAKQTNFTDPKIIKIFSNADTYIEEINGEWLAETEYWFVPDDFAVIKMHFIHEPSQEDLEIAFGIRKFEQQLNPVEIFRCRSCGRLINWLDIDGDIEKKLHYAEEGYCGC